jgi:hypothetical protein
MNILKKDHNESRAFLKPFLGYLKDIDDNLLA